LAGGLLLIVGGAGASHGPLMAFAAPTNKMTTPGAFLSSHPRDIGGLYLILAAFSGGLGHGFSHPIRMGVARAGPQLLVGSDPPYPVILTAHAILMIFFMAMAALLGGFGNWFVPPLIL
jgi:heme/copper-type cytochrome/quinol oxidase subunit 1